MEFHNTKITDTIVELNRLEEIMAEENLTKDEHWDFNKLTFDRKFSYNFCTYYLRCPGIAVHGDIGSGEANIQLLTPVLGEHHFPHGVTYDEPEAFPSLLRKKCEEILDHIGRKLQEID